MTRRMTLNRQTRVVTTAIALLSSVTLVVGQTRITAPSNKYSVQDDVKMGRDAANEVEEQLPLLRESRVESYVEDLGARIVSAIPPEFDHPEFRYTFKVVNVRDINAFALPGGPMYVNRGMIEAAHSEGEVVGVIAHEISHVALRHGTAQASKATKYEVGSIAGQILGAIIGGGAGQAVSAVSQFGFGTAFLRFGREYEKQADLLGAQIMSRANYDPREMANMFKTIEKTSGGGGPEFLSDHPNPANRYNYILEESRSLQVDNPVRNSQAFADIQSRLKRMTPAPTSEDAMRKAGSGRSGRGGGYPSDSQIGRVDPPSSRYQLYDEGDIFQVSVPANWRELPGNTTVTFAPEGAYGRANGQSVFTHGMEIGVDRTESHNVRTATDELISGLAQSNPRLRRIGGYANVTIDGRRGLATSLSNVSDATGQPERINLYTTQLSDGSLFYALGVAPTDEFATYQRVFNRAVESIRLTE